MSVHDTWERRIERAEQLAARNDAAGALVASYATLLRFQQGVSERLRDQSEHSLSGALEQDLPRLRPEAERLLVDIANGGPQPLAVHAHELLNAGGGAIDRMLLASWRDRNDRDFFARVVLQSYASALGAAAIAPVDRNTASAANACPFCGGSPQLAILHAPREDGGRHLLCATCLGTWRFRRIGCASCGNDDEHRLVSFDSPEWPHVRIDACDRCRHYLKTIDLTRCGVAVPLVDEVAAAALDVWAREQGYTKIHLNLLGL